MASVRSMEARLTRARQSAFARMEPTVVNLSGTSGKKLTMSPGSGAVPLAGQVKPGSDATTKGGASPSQPTVFSVAGEPPPGSAALNLQGRIINDVSLQILFWGAAWAQASPSTGAILAAIDRIIASQYLTGLEQYGVQSVGLAGPPLWAPYDEPPNPFQTPDIGDFVWRVINGNLSEPDDGGPNLYMVFLPPGVAQANTTNVGEHAFAQGGGLFDNENVWFGWIKNGTLNAIMTSFSHELVEAATDPEGFGIQMDPPNPNNWNEIGDACQNSVGPLDGAAGAVQVQAYFSQNNNACIIPNGPNIVPIAVGVPAPPFPPGDYRITSVTRSSHNGKPFIFAVSGNDGGTSWILGDYIAMGKILNDGYTFYTNEDGRRANVTVVTSPNGHFHLQTEADDTRLNNLSSLPDTPASLYTDPQTFIDL
jgi:hypothetical protein